MSNKRFFGFTEFSNWVLGKVTGVLNTVDGLLANTVQKTDDFGQYKVGEVELSLLLADLADGADLQTLQNSFADFVAAKATEQEAIAGVDNVKYLTALGAKAAIEAAVNDLVGSAPEALDTIAELAAAMQNSPDVVANLTTLVGQKLDANGTAVNSQRLEGKTLAEVIGRITNGEVSFGASAVEFTPYAEYLNAAGRTQSFKVEDGFQAGFNMNLTMPNERGELVYDFDGVGTYNVTGSVYGQDYQGVYQDYTAAFDVPGNKLQVLRLAFNPTEVTQMRVTVNSIAGVGQDAFYFRTGSESRSLYEDDPYEFTLDPNAESGYLNEQENARNINLLEIGAFSSAVVVIAHLSHVTFVLERLVNGQWVNVFATGGGGLSLVALDTENDQLAQRLSAVETGKLNSDAQAFDSAKLEGRSKAEVMADTKTFLALGTASKSDIFVSTVDPISTDGKDGDLWIKYTP